VKYVEFEKRFWKLGLVYFDQLTKLEDYCQENGIDFAINGGFFGTEYNYADVGSHLGELWIDKERIFKSSSAFDRGCLYVSDTNDVHIDYRSKFPSEVRGSLLEVGPLLLNNGKTLVDGLKNPEGFVTDIANYDGDLTKGRFPRSALAISSEKVWAIAVEGRSEYDSGMTLVELADFAVSLGAISALNLDGGSASSLVINKKLVNIPRMSADRNNKRFPHGRPIKTAITFS